MSLGFALTLGAYTWLSGLDLRRFARLKKLQLSGFSSDRAYELGWRLILPRSLRVLYMDAMKEERFVVGLQPQPDPDLMTSNVISKPIRSPAGAQAGIL